MRVLWVPADHHVPVEEIELPDPAAHLDQVMARLYELVGVRPGYLDCTTIGPGVRAWVDDEGLLAEVPDWNARLCVFREGAAAALSTRTGQPSPQFPLPLCGDAVVVGHVNPEGDDTDVPNWVVETFREMAF